MTDENHNYTDGEIAGRVAKLAQQGVQFADPLALNMTYLRSLLVYIIRNTEGLNLEDAEQEYYRTMDVILSNAERATAQARILGGIVPSENGAKL